MGKVIEMAEVGGLHHRYERRALVPVDDLSIRAYSPALLIAVRHKRTEPFLVLCASNK